MADFHGMQYLLCQMQERNTHSKSSIFLLQLLGFVPLFGLALFDLLFLEE